MQLVDADEPPLRLFLGPYPYPVAEKTYTDRLTTWDKWRFLSEQASPAVDSPNAFILP